MNIINEPTGELTATLQVKFTEDDYRNEVEKTLKDYQRKASIPGFRPGKVPMGMIRKMYGKAIMAEQIDKLLSNAVASHIEENQLNLLGHPLPNEERNTTLDLDNQKEFEFYFDIALSPSVDPELSEAIEVSEYHIMLEDAEVEKYAASLLKKHGSFINPETVEISDMLTVDLSELDADGNIREGGIKNTTSVFMEHIADQKLKEQFLGKKTGESLDIDPTGLAENTAQRAYLLGVTSDKIADIKSRFRLTINSIGRVVPAEPGPEFYEKVYPGLNINTLEDFHNLIRKDAVETYARESENQLIRDIQQALVKRHQINLPDDFLKRYFFETRKDEKVTREDIERDYEESSDALRWQLIENGIIKKYGIEVKREDAMDYVKSYFRGKAAEDTHEHDHEHEHEHEHKHDHEHEHEHDHDHEHQHEHEHGHEHESDGSTPVDEKEKRLDEIAKIILKNEEEAKKIYTMLFDRKLSGLYREKITIKKVDTNYEDFMQKVYRPR